MGASVAPTPRSRLRPTSNKGALIGDSRLAAALTSTALAGTLPRTVQRSAWGPAFWLQSLTRNRVTFDQTHQFAVSGYTSEQALATVPALIASQPGFAVLQVSTNDRAAAWTYTRTITALQSIIQSISAAGIPLYVIAETPRGTSGFTSTRLSANDLKIHLAVRRWILNTAPTLGPNVRVIDPWPVMVSPSSTTGDIQSTYTYDGVHPNNSGAYQLALLLKAAIDVDFPPQPIGFCSAADTYDATYNTGGNLLVNGLLSGTSGTVSSPATGTAPNNSTLSLTSAAQAGSLTVTGSQVTTATGNWFQIAVTGTTAANAGPGILLDQFFSGNVSAGDVLTATGEYEIDSGATGFAGASLLLSRVSGGQGDNAYDGYTDETVGQAYPGGAITGTFRTPTVTIDGAETSRQIRARVHLQPSATVSVTVRFKNVAVRKSA